MAGASMKDIKLRIRSVQNTMQITKAMQLVASSKLRGARNRMEASRPYREIAAQALNEFASHNMTGNSIYLRSPSSGKTCYIMIAGDRGMAGSYNVSVFKLFEEQRDGRECTVMPIGKKAMEYVRHRDNVSMLDSGVEKADGITQEACEEMAKKIIEGYRNGQYDEVALVYTHFRSILTQIAKVTRILPLERTVQEVAKRQVVCEPGLDAVLNSYIPQYVAGVIYSAVCESVASEQAARRVAMDSATKNAGEMIDNLSLKYNQARQSSITQELTEIVAGAEG